MLNGSEGGDRFCEKRWGGNLIYGVEDRCQRERLSGLDTYGVYPEKKPLYTQAPWKPATEKRKALEKGPGPRGGEGEKQCARQAKVSPEKGKKASIFRKEQR